MTKQPEDRGQCKLCGEDRKLCKSHIVPEFFYTEVYEDHRALKVNLARNGSEEVRTIQKGLRERLLCESCEARINTYERKFKTYWYDSPGLPRKMDLSRERFRMSGADFTSTKLLHLSVLWRAGVSQLFRSVSLGRYSETIRQMLLTEDPGPPECFPVFATVLVKSDGTVTHGLVTEPLRLRFGHSHAYSMCYGGCEWHFIVTDHPTAEEAELSREIDANGDIWMAYRQWPQTQSQELPEDLPRADQAAKALSMQISVVKRCIVRVLRVGPGYYQGRRS